MSRGPCSCWYVPVALHDSHCCFAAYDAVQNVVTCGHDAEGMRAHVAAQGAASARSVVEG